MTPPLDPPAVFTPFIGWSAEPSGSPGISEEAEFDGWLEHSEASRVVCGPRLPHEFLNINFTATFTSRVQASFARRVKKQKHFFDGSRDADGRVFQVVELEVSRLASWGSCQESCFRGRGGTVAANGEKMQRRRAR